jgi:hypothetical protein
VEQKSEAFHPSVCSKYLEIYTNYRRRSCPNTIRWPSIVVTTISRIPYAASLGGVHAAPARRQFVVQRINVIDI